MIERLAGGTDYGVGAPRRFFEGVYNPHKRARCFAHDACDPHTRFRSIRRSMAACCGCVSRSS
jgi:hypothetical protein